MIGRIYCCCSSDRCSSSFVGMLLRIMEHASQVSQPDRRGRRDIVDLLRYGIIILFFLFNVLILDVCDCRRCVTKVQVVCLSVSISPRQRKSESAWIEVNQWRKSFILCSSCSRLSSTWHPLTFFYELHTIRNILIYIVVIWYS